MLLSWFPFHVFLVTINVDDFKIITLGFLIRTWFCFRDNGSIQSKIETIGRVRAQINGFIKNDCFNIISAGGITNVACQATVPGSHKTCITARRKGSRGRQKRVVTRIRQKGVVGASTGRGPFVGVEFGRCFLSRSAKDELVTQVSCQIGHI
uniref:Uncharacterized protein n=1 Tax=Cacopsylla melanoneura TaxID=428564 RepID=A0A8D8XKS2_9HEMI